MALELGARHPDAAGALVVGAAYPDFSEAASCEQTTGQREVKAPVGSTIFLLLLAFASDGPAESLRLPLRRGGAAALCWFVPVRGLGPPALEGLFILPAVSGLLAQPCVGFKDASVEERPAAPAPSPR